MNRLLRLAVFAASLISLSLCSRALALPFGIAAEGCGGCHQSSGITGSLDLTVSPEDFEPGDDVTVTVTLSSDEADGAGVYITTGEPGQIEPASGGGLKTVSTGLVHDGPRSLSGNAAQFRFTFRAPDTPGGVRFAVFALATDGNGGRGGDTAVEGSFSRVYGCEGEEFFADRDADGHGGKLSSSRLACKGMPPPNTASTADDCNDYDEAIHPGATEICDLVDNNCNEQVDEDSEPVELWPDPDGDGHYGSKDGDPVLGCVGLEGYAAEGGDCRPENPMVHAGAEEACNFMDDDCDGEADERARPICGEGWCRRESQGCDAEYCTPGEPETEVCNYLDDDCDGLTDEGSLCSADDLCLEGSCVPRGTVMDGGVAGGDGDGDGDGDDTGGEPQDASSSSSGCALPSAQNVGALAGPLALGMLALGRRRRAVLKAGAQHRRATPVHIKT